MANRSKFIRARDIASQVGQDAETDLRNGMRTLGLLFRIQAPVQVSVANATAVRNGGSILALVDFVGMKEAGDDVVRLNGRMAGFIGESHGFASPSRVRVTSPNIGTTNCDETIFIPFGTEWQLNATDSAFVEKDPRLSLTAFLNWNPSPDKLFTIGGATITIGDPTITVIQIVDDLAAVRRPLVRPVYREQSFVVTGAGEQPPLYIKSKNFIRALALQADSDVGEQPDIIQNVILRGDTRAWIDAPGMSLSMLAIAREFFRPPAQATVTPSRYLHNFVEGGRLSNSLSPVNDANPRFELQAQPTAAAGATVTRVRLGILELERVPGVTSDKLPPGDW